MQALWRRIITVALLGCLAYITAPAALAQAEKKPEETDFPWVAAHDLKVRPGKETEWSKAIKLGVEVYRDNKSKAVVVLSSNGSLAVAADDADPGKNAPWSSAITMSVRGAGEPKFMANTQLFAAEVFKDTLNGHLLYITERNTIALFKGTGSTDKDPLFQYGLNVKVRKPGVKDFDESAKAYGIEAYKDNNTGGLVYICETGSIAVSKDAPAAVPEEKDVKAPKALYGLECKVRKPNEKEFDTAQIFNIEVYQDANTGALIYVSETGSIATVPAPEGMKSEPGLTWKHTMLLRARPGGVADFKQATTYNVEVYSDANTGYTLFITNTGTIAVLPTK
jgi:hypothetical protein